MKTVWIARTIKVGNLMGEDVFGNRYYENEEHQEGRHRWVMYNLDQGRDDVETSTVPPEWHIWLHHTSDKVPKEEDFARKPWEKPHQANVSMTKNRYMPPGSFYRPQPKEYRTYEKWTPKS